METVFIVILLIVLGAVMGSFLGCMGYRIPNKIKTTHPSSFCNNCKKPLKWYMNIPILSYVFLKGRCAYCNHKIDFIYFFVELVSAILLPCNYLMFGFTFDFWISTILSFILIVTIVSDFLFYYISDRVLIIGIISTFIVNFIFLGTTDSFIRILCGAVIFGFMYLLKLFGNVTFKKESLGDGDIKLMGVIGIAVGLVNSFITLFFGSIIGLVFAMLTLRKNKEGIIPFGPSLLMGALITIYFSNLITPLINQYLFL